MALNPFDDAVQTLDAPPAMPTAPAPPSVAVPDRGPSQEFLDTLDSLKTGRTQQLRAATIHAQDVAPDRAADVLRLSSVTGLGPDVVARNYDDLAKRHQVEAVPYDALQQQTPHLASWVAANPLHAAVAADDTSPGGQAMDHMGALEWLVTMPGRAVAQAINEERASSLRGTALLRDLTPAEQDQLNAYSYHATLDGSLGAGDSWFKGALTKSMKLLTALTVPETLPTAAGLLLGGAVGSIVPGVGTATGATIGAEAGYTYGLGKSAFLTSAGSSYESYRRITDATGQPLDPHIAKLAALANGAINAGLMTVGGAVIGKGIAAGREKIAGLFTRDAIGAALKNPTVVARLATLAATSASSFATTMTEGVALTVAQQAADILASEIAKTTQAQPVHRTVGEAAGEIGTAAKEAVQSFALIAGAGPALGLTQEALRAARGKVTPAFVEALGEGIAQSKTAQRAPGAVENLVSRAAGDQTWYLPVDSWTAYWQAHGEDPAAKAAALTGKPDAYAEAQRTNTDLAVSPGRFATQLANTEHNAFFKDELRLGPREMNGRESADWLAAEQQRIAAEPPPATEPTAVEQAHQALIDTQIQAGTPADVADTNAALVRAAFGTTAERAGVDPLVEYARRGIVVQRPEQPQAASAGLLGTEAAPASEVPAGAPVAAGDATAGPVTDLSPEAAIARLTDQAPVQERRQAAGVGPGGVERRIATTDTPAGFTPQQSIAERAAALRAENPSIDQQAAEARAKALAAGRIPEPVGRPASPLGQAIVDTVQAATTPASEKPAFRDEIARMQKKAEAWRQALTAAFNSPGGARTVNAAGVQHLVHLSTAEPGKIQITSLDADGTPSGHRVVSDLAEAARELAGETLVPGVKVDSAETPAQTEARYGPEPLTRQSPDPSGESGRPGVAASRPRERETPEQFAARKAEHTAAVVADLLDAARALDPGIDVARLTDEITYRLQTYDELKALEAESGHDPHDLLRAIAANGGLGDQKAGGYEGEVRWLKDGLKFGAVRGADNKLIQVFRKTERRGAGFKQGLGFDGMLEALQQDPRFAWLQSVNHLIDAVGEALRYKPEDVAGVLPGTDELRAAVQIKADEPWWLDPWKPALDAAADVADVSFDFGANAPGDVLDTGEVQPRLPGDVGAVRDTTNATPEMPIPFALMGEVADVAATAADLPLGDEPSKTFFQSFYHGSPHDFDEFSLRYIGTGEGAQAYGHGLYFAENPDVAESYKVPGRTTKIQFNGRGIWELTRDQFKELSALTQRAIRRVLEDSNLDEAVANAASSGDRDVMREIMRLRQSGELTDVAPGKLYQVDIPDAHVAKMLHWDKPLSEQSHVVEFLRTSDVAPFGKESIGWRDAPAGLWEKSLAQHTGEELYRALGSVGLFEGEPADQATAAQALVAAGIPGIKYFDQGSRVGRPAYTADPAYLHAAESFKTAGESADAARAGLQQAYTDATPMDLAAAIAEAYDLAPTRTHNVVVFDDAIVKVTHKDGSPVTAAERKEFFQSQQGPDQPPRASITIGPDGKTTINLFEHADLTSFLHEAGHLFLDTLGAFEDQLKTLDPASLTPQQQQLLADHQALLTTLGVDSKDQITRAHHEELANLFTDYLKEGKAPSVALQPAFARFRAWLLDVYKALRQAKTPLTDEVRRVFDRLLASDQAIADAEARRGAQQFFATAEEAGMSPERFAIYQETLAAAHREAQQTLDQQLLQDVRREQTARWKADQTRIQAEVTAELEQQPVYKALAAIRKGAHPDGSPLIEGQPPEPLTLSRGLVADRYPNLNVPADLLTADGRDPDLVAELVGYPSGRALLNAIADAPPLRKVIAEETRSRLWQLHGSTLLDGTLPEKADAAVANDRRADVVRMELQALWAKANPEAPAGARRGDTHAEQERAYERRWFEAEAKLRIAIAEGHKQVEIDALRQQVSTLKAKARGGAAAIARGIPSAEAIRTAAQTRIDSLPLRAVKPAEFWAAARRAGQAAVDHAARQDIPSAITAKTQELVSLAHYKAAEAARTAVDEALTTFQQFNKPDATIAQTRNLDLVQAGRAVLASVGLGRRPAERIETYLTQLRTYDPDLHASLLDQIQAATPAEAVRDYRDLSYGAFKALSESVDALWALARSTEAIEVGGEKLQLRDVRNQILGKLHEFSDPRVKAGYTQAVSGWDRVKVGLLGFRARGRRVEDWVTVVDNGREGIARRAVYDPINAGAVAYDGQRAELATRYAELAATLDADKRVTKIAAPELNYTFTSKHEDLLGALLHTGNGWAPGSNGDKLLRGRGWTKDGWDSFVGRMTREGVLTKADFDFVQGVWDLQESLKPAAQAVHKTRFGRYFDEVTAVPIDTPWGSYRGGYYPAIADPFITPLAADRAEANSLLEGGGGGTTMFPSVGRGFTQTRTEGYAKPLILDASQVLSHVNSVLRFIHLSGPVHDVARLILHPEFRGALDAVDPAAVSDLLVPYLQRAARQTMFTPLQGKAGRAADAVAREIRNRGSMQIIALNATVLAEQFTHFPSVLAHGDVEPGALLAGVWRLSRDPKGLLAEIHDASPYMKTRESAGLVEAHAAIDRILLDPNPAQRGAAWVQDHSTVLMRGIQAGMDAATWQAVYSKVSAEPGMTHDAAVLRADAAVRQALGSYRPQDRAALEGGSQMVGLLNQFYGFFNTKLNMLGTEAALTSRMGLKRSFSRGLGVYAFGFMIPALLGEGIKNAFKGQSPIGQGPDEDAAIALARFWGVSQLKMGARMIPFGGAAVSAVTMAFQPGRPTSLLNAPSITMVENALHAPGEAYRALTDTNTRTPAQNAKAITDFFTMLGLMSNLPMRPVGQAVNALHDYAGQQP